MFSNLKKAAAVFVSAAVLSVPAADMFAVNISSADLQRPQGRYLNEAIYEAGGRRYLESRDKWVEFISVYSLYGYYNAPFSTGLYAASPYGDRWQFDSDAHAQLVTKDGGSAAEGCMTSTGFVWHALSAGLSLNGGLGFNETCTWIPNVNYFNDQGFDRKSWRGANGGRWYNYLTDYNVCYYEFSTKEEMLSSGKLRKGDIIWTVDGAVGTGMAGLSVPADNHHVGIYTGDGRSDLWWQSGPTQGNGIFTDAKNSVNPIYGCAASNTYVVIPFAREGVTPTAPPATAPPATAPPATTPPATTPPATTPAVPPATAPVSTQAAVTPPVTAPVSTAAVQPPTVPPFTARNNEGWGLATAPPAPVTTAAPTPSWGVGGVVIVPTSPVQQTPQQTGVQGWGPGGVFYQITTHPVTTTTTTTTTAVPTTSATEAPVTTAEPPVTTVTEAPHVTVITEAPVTVPETAAPVTEVPSTAAPVTEAPTAVPTAEPTSPPVTTAAPVPTATVPVTTAEYKYGDMHNENGVYFNEALKTAGSDTAAVTPAQWQSFLNEYSLTDYYTATPYTLSIYSASPKGDNWQFKEFSSPADYGVTSDKGGMESMGFVWHALSNVISKSTGESIATAGQSVPLLGSFNDLSLSRKCWNDSGWYNFISKYKVHYYEFADKASMLASGKLHKGDIIWTIDSESGIGYNGLLKIASHHVGIYMGDGSSDLWWSTGPTKGNGDFSEVKNSITPVYGMAQSNSYLVIPFAKIDSSYVEPPAPAGKTGDVTGDGLVDSADASMILDDYAKASTSGQHLLSADKLKLSDVNGDGLTDSSDASAILDYYSYISTGGNKTISEYLSRN